MRRFVSVLIVVSACAGFCFAQQSKVEPQTARQALMEMFFSKTPGTFVKHLPMVTRTALEKSGALTSLQQYSLMMSQLQTDNQNLQTFDTGSVLLRADNPKTGENVEITVENDNLHGDQDDIELTFHVHKNGADQRAPFMPRMTFTMKQESQIWKLNEISVTIRVPLADPELLKAITEKMTAPPAVTHTTFMPQSQTSVQLAGSDEIVLGAMRTILTAETTYSNTYPDVGYTCSLSSLDGFGGGEPNPHQAMLINSGLASGRRFGFVFTLTECSAAPARSFRLTAVPNTATFGRKAYCADQSGVIRSSNDGSAATCIANGTPVQ